tara:strand:+ start:202 stop:900 length:699 start_codon:yes stop_codon:yes gene_type:complete
MEQLDIHQIKEKLIDQGIYEKKVKISMNFLDVDVESAVKDSFGYMFQGWLAAWFEKNNIFYSEPENSQSSPDFFIDKNDKKKGLVEVKCFYKDPNFDLHGWEAFLNLLEEKPYHIDADYLIFEYDLDYESNNFSIENILIRKIWETSKPMSSRSQIQWPINVQFKNQTLVNLRTCGKHDLINSNGTYYDRKSFLEAIQKAIEMYSKAREEHRDNKWFQNVSNKYKKITGSDI